MSSSSSFSRLRLQGINGGGGGDLMTVTPVFEQNMRSLYVILISPAFHARQYMIQKKKDKPLKNSFRFDLSPSDPPRSPPCFGDPTYQDLHSFSDPLGPITDFTLQWILLRKHRISTNTFPNHSYLLEDIFLVKDTAAISELGQEGLEDIEEPPDRNKRQIEGGDSEPSHRDNKTSATDWACGNGIANRAGVAVRWRGDARVGLNVGSGKKQAGKAD
ncbi:hypothetical protein BJY52DRAFT_1228477 [Lactarius psammicola]|nr:hypothetical protein BJY52DRAFT_1228477 [Lactarius psammicola]